MTDSALLIYLHGFQSSTNSYKAQRVEAYLQQHQPTISYYCPQIPDVPTQAIAFLDALLAEFSQQERRIYLIGSSLGGFYAAWLADKYRCKAVLVNPAMNAPELLDDYLGEHINPYTANRYTLSHEELEALSAVSLASIMHPEYYWVLLQMADEVLDATIASRFFYPCRCLIEPGGDHTFQNFERYLPAIFAWFTAE